MTRPWKQALAVVFAMGMVGGAIACTGEEPTTAPSDESTSPLPPDDGTGSGPLGVLNPIELLSPQCTPFTGSNYTGDVKAACVEVWGEYLVELNDEFTDPPKYHCRAYGHPPADAGVGFPSDWIEVWTPTGQPNSLSHTFTIKGHRNNDPYTSWMTVNATDATRFKGEGTPWRPSNPGEYATVTCTVDGVSAVGEVWIVGDPLELKSINVVVPKSTILTGEQTQLTPEFIDNYNYKNDLVPAPTVNSWASNATSIATVSSTGLVTGTGRGTAQITVTATRGSVTKTKTVSITVKGCSIATSPSGTYDMVLGASQNTTTTLTCDANTAPPSGNWVWTSSNPYQGVKVYGNNPNGTWGLLSAEMKGTSLIHVCTPAGLASACSPDITVRVFATSVSSSLGGATQNVGINSSGSILFKVKNTGAAPGTAAISCSGAIALTCTGVSTSSMVLAPGDSGFVTATWTTGTTTGTGGIELIATGGNGWVGFEVTGGSVTSSINYGPTSVKPGAYCEWMAAANGGTAPYSWQWTVDGSPVTGSANDIYYTNSKSNGQSFQLGITVTDANSNTHTSYRTVSVSNSAPTCDL